MPYCRDCGDQIYGRATYCSSCESDIVSRARSSVREASYDERRRMENDRHYAHRWLQSMIGWIIGLMDIITRVFTGCFVTTAVLRRLSCTDTSPEMELLRDYRDSYLMLNITSERRADLQEYYLLGPILVTWADSRRDSARVWEYITDYVLHTLEMIREEKHQSAYAFFRRRTLNLQRDILFGKHRGARWLRAGALGSDAPRGAEGPHRELRSFS